MKDVKNRIYGECRELIESYDLPTNHLRGALDEHYNNKSWINQTLGLSEDNNYRIVLPLANTMETRPDAMELIKEIEKISEESIRRSISSSCGAGKTRCGLQRLSAPCGIG